MGVGERSAAHGDEVGGAHGEQGVGHLRVVNAVGEDDGDVHDLLDEGAAVHVDGVRGEHGGDDLVGGLAGVHAV